MDTIGEETKEERYGSLDEEAIREEKVDAIGEEARRVEER